MKIGDEGAESLGRALQNDHTVAELCLAGARISSVGVSVFARYVPDIKALRHLDLCNNAICDSGAAALAAALPYCVLLEQCNLAGNRITGLGAVKLVQAVFVSPLTWLRCVSPMPLFCSALLFTER
jgi:Ran GTPase-activating protein (RanGAP) involved in mRNA processing and transport